MSKDGLVFENLAQLLGNLRDAGRDVEAAAQRGLVTAGVHILGVSNERVPYEEGDLARSGGVSAEGLVVAVSYDTDYAVKQHEDMSLSHDDGRQAKFLESAMNSERQTALKLIADPIRREL